MEYQECIKLGIHKLVNLALIGAALGLIISSIVVFNTWPIYTATNIIPQENAQFPDLSICSLSSGYKELVLQVRQLKFRKSYYISRCLKINHMNNWYFIYFKEHGIASIKRYNYKENLNWTSNNTDISPQQLFLNATYSLTDIVKKIDLRFLKSDEKGMFTEKLNLQKSNNLIQEQRHRKFGRCYTLSPDSRMRRLGIYYIKIQL